MNIKYQFNSTEKVAVKNLINLKFCSECLCLFFERLEIKYLQKLWSQLPNQLFSEKLVEYFCNSNEFPFF